MIVLLCKILYNFVELAQTNKKITGKKSPTFVLATPVGIFHANALRI